MGTTYETVLARRSISPAVRTNGTVNGAAVSLLPPLGADGGVAVVITGTITDGSHAVSIEESANGSTGWVAIPAARLSGAAPTIVLTDDDTQFELGFVAVQSFVRVVIVTTGATTGGLLAAVVLTSEVQSFPVSHA